MNSNDDRPLGPVVHDWTPPPRPGAAALDGVHVRLEPLSADRHAARLYRNYDGHPQIWHYLPYGPFSSASQYHRWVREHDGLDDPRFYAIHSAATDGFAGVASYLRITPEAGSIEVGHINLSPALQGTRDATEAMVLMMAWAFDAGYRRYEWKCDALNLASRRAAQRLGFSFEGVFRQASVVKGRNRDTAWFAVIDSEWPALKEAFAAWLAPSNFDANGQQRERLSDLTRLVRPGRDPALEG